MQEGDRARDTKHDEYIRNLPRKRMASGCMVFDSSGKMLLVKPSYREVWHLPGGVVEREESPLDAANRELNEETGLLMRAKDLLCIDYKKGGNEFEEAMLFIFDYGVISDDQILQIRIDNEEIEGHGFFDVMEAKKMVSESMRRRIGKVLKAREQNKILYLEDGIQKGHGTVDRTE